jgi:predicted transcriptional regulator of viral defense system
LGPFLSVVLFKLTTMNVPQEQPVSSVSPDQAIARHASSQHGVFTWDQAVACGLSPEMVRRRIAAGRWERLSKGIYRLGGAPATWRQGLLATCFAAGPDAVASHLAAAALHRLPAGRTRLEITVPKGRRFRREDVVAHETTLLPAVDVESVDGIPVTTPARTVVDLAAVLAPAGVEDNLDAAISSGLVARPRAQWRLDELAEQGRPGIRVLRD